MEDNCNYVLDCYVDVRLVAQALLVCNEQGIEIHSASELGRQCISAIAARSTIQISSVQSALDILSSHGCSLKQFARRGKGVRSMLVFEDAAPRPAGFDERASEIANAIEGSK